MLKIHNMLYSVYVESTPNPEVMKFVSNRMIVDQPIEINSIAESKNITIAQELFKFPFIKRVYLNNNFISIYKIPDIQWEDIAMQLRTFITDYLNDNGIKNYTEHLEKRTETETETENKVKKEEKNNQLFTNEEKHIISILDQYVKPAVESDGGDISLKSFKNNIVTVQLKGACNGCPSASMTLKNGIEALLKEKVNAEITVVSE